MGVTLGQLRDGQHGSLDKFPLVDGPRALPWAGALAKAGKPVIYSSERNAHTNYLGSGYVQCKSDFIRSLHCYPNSVRCPWGCSEAHSSSEMTGLWPTT